jgi:arabinofuranan 3-O-arabinosyltransferase
MADLLIWLWKIAAHRCTRYVAAWLAVLGLAAHLQQKAYHDFDSRDKEPRMRRHDGNDGHTSIDFCGQWIMGRMLVLGHGRELYDRHVLYETAQRALPWGDETPATLASDPGAPNHDSDQLMAAFIDVEVGPRGNTPRQARERTLRQTFALPLAAAGPLDAIALVAVPEQQYWKSNQLNELRTKHIGGPLYPPTHALVMAPLALDDDVRSSYRLMQWIMLLAGFAAGAGASVLTRGRVWCPVATLMIMLYPGYMGDHSLGQNGPVSLAIIVWGWALMSRGYWTAGGMVWGLLVFKPVWAAAFFLAPLLTGRWRTCAAMIAVGIGMVAMTIPFVGVESWRDWARIGEIANRTYEVDGNWVPLSRDLLGIPRRFLINTDGTEYFGEDRWEAHVAGWALWAFVVEATVRLTRWRPELFRTMTGPAAGFLLLGAWLSCFHFMYYDVILSALAYLVLLDPPSAIFRPIFVGTPPDEKTAEYYRPRLVDRYPGESRGWVWVANSFLIYFGIALLIAQHTMPWLDLGITITGKQGLLTPTPMTSAGEVVVKDGKTVMSTPKIVITTTTAGPPWDTYCLLVLWAWCGISVAVAGLCEAGPGSQTLATETKAREGG